MLAYEKYPLVLPAVLKMMSVDKIEKSVVQLHFSMIKNLVI